LVLIDTFGIGAPKNYGMIVFPGFQAMDVFGPLDVLNTVSFFTDTLNLSILASTLEPVSTSTAGNSSFSERIVPTHTFKHPPKNLDVLIVPGGGGTRAAEPQLLDAIKYIKKTYPKLQYIISVCTGATLLARAGVLDGKHATTNKKAWAWATSQGPNVKWEPVARWVVDGNVWTTSGISAGLDGIYAYVGHVYGEDVSLSTANGLEYDRHTNASWDPYGKIWGVPGA
jgi:transcriptional regulator GlxA family with amidase domain